METTTIEIMALDIAKLILYDKLDGCIRHNEYLADGIVAVLGGMHFHKETDKIARLYRIWVERG